MPITSTLPYAGLAQPLIRSAPAAEAKHPQTAAIPSACSANPTADLRADMPRRASAGHTSTVEAAQKAEERRGLEEMEAIKKLAARDREVRAHEQAHMAVGGRYAGGASYQYERGPNGVAYAVAGEVPISTGEEATAAATLEKARIVRRAALAPAQPSPADRQVAAEAAALEAKALRDMQREAAAAAQERQQASAQEASAKASATATDSIRFGEPRPEGTQAEAYDRPGNIFVKSNPYHNRQSPGVLISRFA